MLSAVACGGLADGDGPTSVTQITFAVKVPSPDAPPVDGECPPTEKLHVASDCSVMCAMLVIYPEQTNQAAGCTDPGMSQPDELTLARFHTQTPNAVACAYEQLAGGPTCGTCEGSSQSGWCYVTPDPHTGCSSGFAFGASGPPAGTTLLTTCFE